MPTKLFEPGKSGNPKGRPKKGGTLTELLREELGRENVNTPEGYITARQAIARRAVKMAVDGDFNTIRWIYDRVDGLLKQTIEHEGAVPIKAINDPELDSEPIGDDDTD